MFTIESEATEVDISPEVGGSVLAFRINDRDILRPTPPGVVHPLQTASFPLVPWVNRIDRGRFFFEESMVTLPPPMEGEPHAMHGHGWLVAWTAEDVQEDSATIAYHHGADSWPWTYRARQTFTVEPGRLTMTLTVTNLTDAAMPLGLGFHPYFERPARISATVDGSWVSDDGSLPERWEQSEPFRANEVDGLALDNTFTGWDKRAVLDGARGRILVSSDLDLMHLFAPRGRSYFCLEPVSSAPDAFNHPDRGLRRLATGESVTATMRIAAG